MGASELLPKTEALFNEIKKSTRVFLLVLFQRGINGTINKACLLK